MNDSSSLKEQLNMECRGLSLGFIFWFTGETIINSCYKIRPYRSPNLRNRQKSSARINDGPGTLHLSIQRKYPRSE